MAIEVATFPDGTEVPATRMSLPAPDDCLMRRVCGDQSNARALAEIERTIGPATSWLEARP